MPEDSGVQPRSDQAQGQTGPDGERTGTGFVNVARSVGAAMIGVQSSKNKERDFKHGKPLHFIIGGLIGTFLFLLAVAIFVKVVIATA